MVVRDLTGSGWVKLKGLLFLVAGVLAGALLLMEAPSAKVGLLLAVVVWCFCRAYYFAFYVIERYVDPSFRFSGLISLARHLIGRR